MTTADPLLTHRDEILHIAERHGARNVRVFGSVARCDTTGESDIDLLVSTTEHTSPWLPACLTLKLQDLLGRRVDVVTEDGLYFLLRRRILQEARPLSRTSRMSTVRMFSSAPITSRRTFPSAAPPSRRITRRKTP